MSPTSDFRLKWLYGAVLALCVLNARFLTAAERPSWINRHSHPSFPESHFIIGVGVSERLASLPESQRIADNSAFEDIARQLIVYIHSKSTSNITENTYNAISKVTESQFSAELAVSVDQTLPGVRIIEHYEDSRQKCIYSLAVIERELAMKHLSHSLEQLSASCDSVRRAAETFTQIYDYPQALSSLQIHYRLAVQYNLQAQTYNSVQGLILSSSAFPKNDWDIVCLERADNILSHLSLFKLGGEDQDLIINQPLTQPLSTRLDYVSEKGERFPVKGYNVLYTTNVGDLELGLSQVDNESGVSSIAVKMVRPTATNQYEVKAVVDFVNLLDSSNIQMAKWNEMVQNRSVGTIFRFRWLKIRRNFRVGVVIFGHDSESERENALIGSAIKDRLQDLGMQIIEAQPKAFGATPELNSIQPNRLAEKFSSKMDLLILGVVSIKRGGESVLGRYSLGECDARVYALDSPEMLFTTRQTSKGFGGSDEQADQKAIANLAKPLCDAIEKDITMNAALRR